jgi:hypothetical protein
LSIREKAVQYRVLVGLISFSLTRCRIGISATGGGIGVSGRVDYRRIKIISKGLIVDSTQLSPKDRMIEVIQGQPDDSSYDELLRELAIVRMVQRGLDDVEAGRTITHEELLRKIESWQNNILD